MAERRARVPLDQTVGYALATRSMEDGVYKAEFCECDTNTRIKTWFRVSDSVIKAIYARVTTKNVSREVTPVEMRYILALLLARDVGTVQKLSFEIRSGSWYKPSPEDLIYAFRYLMKLYENHVKQPVVEVLRFLNAL